MRIINRIKQFFSSDDSNSNSAYQASRSGRRLVNWRPGAEGPNAINQGNLTTLINRSRDSARNNPWVASAQNNWVADEVGTGITPRSMAPNDEFKQNADALWKIFEKECDADGVSNFAGLLALAVRGRREAGEIFIRLRSRTVKDGLEVPLQIQLLESEFCPLAHTDVTRRIKSGIELDGVGKRRAYWMYSTHPGEFEGDRFDMLKPVPAQSVIHHYAPIRPGQLRGIPATVQALIKAKDFDEYDDAELTRKKTRASYTGAITRPDYGEEDYNYDPISGMPLEKDSDDIAIVNNQPGSWFNLLPGEVPHLFEGDKSGDGYADFMRAQLFAIAAAQGVPYEIMTGDMSSVNDRTLRAILNQYRRLIEQTQWLYTIPQICDRVWSAFIDHAVMVGKLSAPDYLEKRKQYQSVEWRPDGWPYIHPVQDVQAKILKVNAGFSSRSAEVAQEGWDASEVDQQNAEDNHRARDLDLEYSTDTSLAVEPDNDIGEQTNA